MFVSFSVSDIVLSMDESKEGSRGISSDLMIRRMKNRERQRKYRERKRLRDEADSDAEIYGYVENFVRRVYCCRDWKQDARRAHLMNITHSRRDWKAEARKMKN